MMLGLDLVSLEVASAEKGEYPLTLITHAFFEVDS